MNDDDLLAEIDLHAWRVPPPAPLRSLTPVAVPRKRPRIAWLLAAIVIAQLVTLVVIVLARPPATTVYLPAGGSVNAQLRDVLARLEAEKRELERKLAELDELRARVIDLTEKLRQYEQRERTVPKPAPRPRPIDPFESTSCDEVSCVLSNYDGACCAKFRTPQIVKPSALPESLDRQSISSGIASVRATINACATSSAKGIVKVRVQVAPKGVVTNAAIEKTPDPALGLCVARAIQRAVFAPTQHGGSFTYPFVF